MIPYECLRNVKIQSLQVCFTNDTNAIKFVLIVLHSTEMSIRMLANLTTTTNALPTIRMVCDRLQICCEYAFQANFRSMFLILVKPQN